MEYQDTLLTIAKSDPRVLVMTAENRAPIRGIISELGDRFIDTGITEQTLVGMAAGLALRGRVPVVHGLATFLTMRAFEFIRTDVGYPCLPVKFIGFIPGFLSEGNGPTHQSLEDISLMRSVPNMQIFCPSDREELCQMLPDIVASPAPAYIRYVTNVSPVTNRKKFQIGQADVVTKGFEVTILSYGVLFNEARIAADFLKSEGVSVGLVNLRSLKPIDERCLLEILDQSEYVVTLEDHFLTGGLFSTLCELSVKLEHHARIIPIALDERWFRPGLLKEVLEAEGFTGHQLAEKISKTMTADQRRLAHEQSYQ